MLLILLSDTTQHFFVSTVKLVMNLSACFMTLRREEETHSVKDDFNKLNGWMKLSKITFVAPNKVQWNFDELCLSNDSSGSAQPTIARLSISWRDIVEGKSCLLASGSDILDTVVARHFHYNFVESVALQAALQVRDKSRTFPCREVLSSQLHFDHVWAFKWTHKVCFVVQPDQ